MLSASDLRSLQHANAHFSDDLLSSILNEPIPGQGVFWSSVGGKPYPISLRALSFENMFSVRDPDYNRPAGRTYAHVLRQMTSQIRDMVAVNRPAEAETAAARLPTENKSDDAESEDIVAMIRQIAVEALKSNKALISKIESESGVPWGTLNAFIGAKLPQHLDNKDDLAYRLVPQVLDAIYGRQGEAWEAYRVPIRDRTVTYVRKKS